MYCVTVHESVPMPVSGCHLQPARRPGMHWLADEINIYWMTDWLTNWSIAGDYAVSYLINRAIDWWNSFCTLKGFGAWSFSCCWRCGLLLFSFLEDHLEKVNIYASSNFNTNFVLTYCHVQNVELLHCTSRSRVQ